MTVWTRRIRACDPPVAFFVCRAPGTIVTCCFRVGLTHTRRVMWKTEPIRFCRYAVAIVSGHDCSQATRRYPLIPRSCPQHNSHGHTHALAAHTRQKGGLSLVRWPMPRPLASSARVFHGQTTANANARLVSEVKALLNTETQAMAKVRARAAHFHASFEWKIARGVPPRFPPQVTPLWFTKSKLLSRVRCTRAFHPGARVSAWMAIAASRFLSPADASLLLAAALLLAAFCVNPNRCAHARADPVPALSLLGANLLVLVVWSQLDAVICSRSRAFPLLLCILMMWCGAVVARSRWR